MARDDFAGFIDAHRPVAVVGDCAAIVGAYDHARCVDVVYPDPVAMAHLAAACWENHCTDGFLPAEPVYLRDAEVSHPKKKGRVIAENQ